MIKNKINKILAASFLVCASTVVISEMNTIDVHASEINSVSEGVVINTSVGLNLRKEATTSSKALRLLPNGSKVKVFSKTGLWYSVEVNGLKGYVHSDYLKVNNKASETKDDTVAFSGSTVGKVIDVDNMGLNLRKGASTSSKRMLVIPEGSTLKIHSKSGSWYKVTFNNKVGYVSSKYVEIAKSNNSSTGEVVTNDSTSSIVNKAKTGTVVNTNKAGLNLRKTASATSKKLLTIPEGITINLNSQVKKWYKTVYKGKVGYVSSDYIKVKTSVTATKPSETVKPNNSDIAYSSDAYVGDTEKLGLFMRKIPNGDMMLTVPEGAEIKITAKNGEWYKITYSNKTGYVHSDYIVLGKKTPAVVTPVPTPTPAPLPKPTQPSNSDITYSSDAYVGDTEKLGLFMRKTPGGDMILTVPEGAVIKITAKNGEWYKITYNNKTGYVHSDYIVLGKKTPAIVTPAPKPTPIPTPAPGNSDVSFSSDAYVGDTENLGLFMRTSTTGSVMLTIPQGAAIKITAKNGTWYKVTYGGKTGYAHSDYIVLGKKPAATKPTTPSQSTATFEAVFNIMKEHIGTPYVWGGSGEYITDSSIANLKSRFPYEAADGWFDYIGRGYYNKGYRAFDCSGLMQWAFAKVGISMGRVTYTQANAGVGVNISDAKPGDLLLTYDQGHIGMYIGDNKWIESPTPGASVRISNVPWSHIGYARRVL